MAIVAVVDVETTGVDPKIDRVVEVAGVGLDSKTLDIVSRFECLVDPGVPIPAEASAIHHIVDADVSGQRSAEDAKSDLLSALSPDYLCAHNSRFDEKFLVIGNLPWVDTYRSAMRLVPDAPRFGNQVLRYHLKLEPIFSGDSHAHRAMYDVEVTVELLKHLLKLAPLEKLLEFSCKPALLSTCNFGKHKGLKWDSVPREYLYWVLKTGGFDEDVEYTVRHHLNAKSRA